MSDSTRPTSPPARSLPSDAVANYTLEAQKEGIFAGLASGLASAVIGSRFMGFSRNKTLLSGVLSGVLAGYLFTQAFTATAMARLRADQAQLQLNSKDGKSGESALPGALERR
ncbi:hypothetical protein HGRIS_007364 [Hohenbuehelia grisea]|uniref:Reactive oxygen species modulator 1 n=1 Tax=Hohenbuehelia grisea TaxID=104357 RepID=A0ABR3J5A9_9AGAR